MISTAHELLKSNCEDTIGFVYPKPSRALTALFTKPTDCEPPSGALLRDRSPIHGQWAFFRYAGIVPGKSKERPGTLEVSGFVNHVVMFTFELIKLMSRLHCSPQGATCHRKKKMCHGVSKLA